MSERPPALTASRARAWRERWDRQQARGVADREERFEAILEALGATVGARFRFLDVGCGTGSLSERILRRFPRARSVAVDHDPVLLAIGRAALGTMGGRLAWVDADLRRSGWGRELPRSKFDAAVSTTALHWFTGPQLSRLYRDLARLIRPRGWFFNGDGISFTPGDRVLRDTSHEVLGARARRAARGGATWDDWWAQVLNDPALRSEAELHRVRYPHSHSGTPTPDVAGHLRRLRAAGFREAGVVWSRWNNRVVAAVR